MTEACSRRLLTAAPVLNVSFVGGICCVRVAAREEGQERGPGPEQGEAVEKEAADHRDQVSHREDEGPDHRGEGVTSPVMAGGEDDPPAHEVRGHERPEEDEGQVCRGEEQQERYPYDRDREHHGEH